MISSMFTRTRPSLTSTLSSIRFMSTEKVAIIGSGNWGSAVARIAARNAKSLSGFDDEVKMWVFEEEVEGRKLTEIINTDHENVKYLPGAKFTDNLVAVPTVEEATEGATALVMCLPHQFLPSVLAQMKPLIHKDAKAISLIKGMDFDDKGAVLISDIMRKELNVDVAALMGANVANEVGADEFCEATVGYKSEAAGKVWKELFDCPTFRVNIVNDPYGVEVCGALKNIVAIGAGFVDGLGYGTNTKAAIIRIGLAEMVAFSKRYFDGVQDDTFFESCGVADLITTCFGGRNRKCAEAFVKTGKPFDEIEAELLNGQKLQGTLTAQEVYTILKRTGAEKDFPFFSTVYKIAFEGADPKNIVGDIV